jgi:methyl-accepting chemotaxis protein
MARRPGLRVRLVALVAVGATAVLTTAALALYDDVTSGLSDAITTELEVRLADLVADLDDPAGAAATQRPVVAQAVDATGRVLVPAGATPLLTHAELAAALEGEVLVDRPVRGVGDDARVLARRLNDGNGDAVVGVTATTTAPLVHVRHRLVVVLLVGGTALTAAVALTGWVLAGAALRPVRRMAQRAQTISMTAPGERLPVPPGGDEIAELGRTLNTMLVRIEATIAHERGFIDDASHELRTPLAVLPASSSSPRRTTTSTPSGRACAARSRRPIGSAASATACSPSLGSTRASSPRGPCAPISSTPCAPLWHASPARTG